MFDFGNDDKEKLRENMEQIKEMVNEGKNVGQEQDFGGQDVEEDEELGDFGNEGFGDEPQQASHSTGQQPQQSQGQDAKPEQRAFDQPPLGDSQDVQGFDDIQADTQEFSDSSADEGVEQQLDEFEEKFGGGPEQASNRQQQPQDQEVQQFEDDTAPNTPPTNQRRSQSTKGGVIDSRDTQQLSQDVPSPPETRELNVPEIDRGPLFLRQQKFLRAKQMIEDMLYLGDEMEKTVNDLEAGLQEDKEIERNVVEILREFEDNRTEVEDIISPREE